MDYYDGLSEKEIHYIDEARIIGRTEGNSKRLSDLITRHMQIMQLELFLKWHITRFMLFV